MTSKERKNKKGEKFKLPHKFKQEESQERKKKNPNKKKKKIQKGKTQINKVSQSQKCKGRDNKENRTLKV